MAPLNLEQIDRFDAIADPAQANAHLPSDCLLEIARSLLFLRLPFEVQQPASRNRPASVAGENQRKVAAVVAVSVEHVRAELRQPIKNGQWSCGTAIR